MNLLRIRLSSGQLRHMHATEEFDFGLERLQKGMAPFSAQWLETTEGSLIQRSQITEIYKHTAEDAPTGIADN
jgi:hypothetical protein